MELISFTKRSRLCSVWSKVSKDKICLIQTPNQKSYMKICILYLVTCQEGYDFGLNMNKDICPLLYPVPSLSNTNKISENKDLAFFSLISLCSVGPDIETRKLSDCRLYKPAGRLNLTFKASRSVY